MIKVSVLYPNNDDARFDMDYYCNRHMALVKEKLGTACKGVSAELGLGGGAPGSKPAYVAMGHILFDSMADMQQALGANAPALMADIPNFTNCYPSSNYTFRPRYRLRLRLNPVHELDELFWDPYTTTICEP